MRRVPLLVALLAGGCASRASSTRPGTGTGTSTTATSTTSASASWASVTRSPWPDQATPRPAGSSSPAATVEDVLRTACGATDGALGRAAAVLLEAPADSDDPDRVSRVLRMHGEPHVRPRVFTASGPDRRRVLDELARRIAAEHRSTSRCGIAAGDGAAERVVVVLVDALADLDELPSRARTGSWLSFDATLHVPVAKASVVVLGPRGRPRTVPTTLDRASGRVRARFALDQPGAFTVQLVGDRAAGPEPLLEARVFADVEPGDDGPHAALAPGEDTVTGDDEDALGRMTAAVRDLEALPALRRNTALDAIAQNHAERMRAAGLLAHDLADGEGDVAARIESHGVRASLVGENVARARTVALAHRALHASPSHRANLLHPEFTDVGFAVAREPGGVVYVTEVFARIR
jgi:uncharacterized protein YkwD